MITGTRLSMQVNTKDMRKKTQKVDQNKTCLTQMAIISRKLVIKSLKMNVQQMMKVAVIEKIRFIVRAAQEEVKPLMIQDTIKIPKTRVTLNKSGGEEVNTSDHSGVRQPITDLGLTGSETTQG